MGLVVVAIPQQMAQAFDIDLDIAQRRLCRTSRALSPCTACSMWQTRIER